MQLFAALGRALLRLTGVVSVVSTLAVAAAAEEGHGVRPDERINYLTFARGAVPLTVGGEGAQRGANFEHAVKIIDGSPLNFSVVSRGKADTVTEFVYALPAPTTFDRFAIPDILETPSPSATFTRTVEVHGSVTSADAGYVLLASAILRTHAKKGESTALTLAHTMPVRWIKLRLVGGIEMPRGEAALAFSELIGNGTQEPAPLVDHFRGLWKAGAQVIALHQAGAVVAGCYDGSGALTGTVSGPILHATGVSRADHVPSAFVLSVTPDGTLRGVRSTNQGPFRLYALPVAPPGTKGPCPTPPPVTLGCGAIIHGMQFDVDTAVLRPEAAPVLTALVDGLKADPSAAIRIEGHTSSEGPTDYNQRLSERRAHAVVAELTRRGLAAARLHALGLGETRPLASNNDENGRSLNRRVEVHCQ